MECAVCGCGDELIYTCGRCGSNLCATHHGRGYHRCAPTFDDDWTPPGSRDVTADMGRTSYRPGEAAADEDGGAGKVGGESPTDDLPPDAARPGYGPDRFSGAPVEPAETIGEWFRRQTYVSLSLKVGFVATLWSAFVFSALAVGLSVVG
ncbi:hypothetical protein HWV07_03615 [Natronomonas salina]|uniref:hypothetical protein n=1 Tax=Natronomonas salina TaxID=1710540 RepID=UPI0015B57E10|nr:hypothetical protein [Natronomonas salina]QLD88171.1 hypothetical protein HWV07_03615 [Natronomonas salina]